MIARRLRPRSLRRLGADRGGATVIEFGIVAPVMVLFIMGIGDLLYGTYANSILLGAVQKAGRDATLQQSASTTATAAIDAEVMAQVRTIAPSATYVSTRLNYTAFTHASKPEPFIDGNGDGIRQVGECYTDMNGNGQWDADGGRSGVGGASDVQQYTITVTYPRIFPVAKLLGGGADATLVGQTLLKNQPYAAQSSPTPPTICT
jgi:Flp pilus assembly protein TadG